MSAVKKHILQARRFEFGRVHHYREAEVLYGKADASDNCAAVTLGRVCMENGQFSLMKKRTDTLTRLRHAAATSEPSCIRRLAIYIAYLSGQWNRESINLLYLAFQKDNYQAEYIMSRLLDNLGEEVMRYLSLPATDRDSLYLECLQRAARLGCLPASGALGCYYWDRRQVEDGLSTLTQAAEGGCFLAFRHLVWRCRTNGSDACYVDMEAFLSHAKCLACDMNDFDTAACLADYLADADRGALTDRVAALRFHRKSMRKEPSEHTYVVLGDRCWQWRDRVFLGGLLPFLRDDYLLSSKYSHFPIVRTSNGLQVD